MPGLGALRERADVTSCESVCASGPCHSHANTAIAAIKTSRMPDRGIQTRDCGCMARRIALQNVVRGLRVPKQYAVVCLLVGAQTLYRRFETRARLDACRYVGATRTRPRRQQHGPAAPAFFLDA